MCGIAGLFDLHDSAREHDPAGIAQRMANAMPYRGPDGFDAWGDAEAGIGLGAPAARDRRSVATPAASRCIRPSGRYVITYNGEVYNFQELRAELDRPWPPLSRHLRHRSHAGGLRCDGAGRGGDQRFVGMFAFAAVRPARTGAASGARPSRREAALLDHLDGTLLFGSELRALMAHPSLPPRGRPEAIAAVVRLQLRAGAGDGLPRRVQAAGRRDPLAAARAVSPGHRTLLAHRRRGRAARPQPCSTAAKRSRPVDALLRDAVRRPHDRRRARSARSSRAAPIPRPWWR